VREELVAPMLEWKVAGTLDLGNKSFSEGIINRRMCISEIPKITQYKSSKGIILLLMLRARRFLP